MQKIWSTLVVAFFIFGCKVYAQSIPDTIRFSLHEAESIFLQKNLTLLAAKYNIDANQALVEQARLWDNPVLTTDQNIYDGAKGDGKFFVHNADRGQVYIQLTQLIKTAGKRSKLAQLAIDNTTLASAQFNDVMRSLRSTLRSDLLEINHQLKIEKIYDSEIIELQRLIKGMDEELKAGNIALKDNMRLKALLFNLQNELVNIQLSLIPVESELKLLLQFTGNNFIAPKLDYQFGSFTTDSTPALDSLIRTALNNRPDAKIAQTTIDFQNHNLLYQKALAKPDVTIGTSYDKLSSYNPNYVGLTIAVPINIFNKNQGNVKSAQFNIRQQETLNNYQYSKIENEVTASFNKLKYFQQVNNLQQLDFSKKYDGLFQSMVKTYQARQISLLEFIDFIDAYKDTKLKLVEQHNNLVKSVEDLNFTTNAIIINIQ